MKNDILTWGFLLVSLPALSQAIIANPQNTDKEGGELVLMNSSSLYNPWNIDNYAGNLRFFHSGSEYFRMLPNGKIGVGTTYPSHVLEITNLAGQSESLLKVRVQDAPSDYFSISNSTGAPSQFIPLLKGHRMSDNRYSIMLMGSTEEANDNGSYALVNFDARRNNGPIQTRPLFLWSSYTTKMMTMLANGNLGIGTTNPGTYKLAVNGNVRAKEVKVDTGWSDFVFEKDYPLPTLQEVEAHIKQNGHLKDIPTAKEVAKNGIYLGQMDAKLLQKIEELTLYTIAQEKQLKDQQTINQQLEGRITKLEQLEEQNKLLTKKVNALEDMMLTLLKTKK